MQKGLKSKEINFLTAVNVQKETKDREKDKKLILAAVPIILFLIVIGVSVFLLSGTFRYSRKTKQIEDKLNSLASVQDSQNITEKQKELDDLSRVENDIQSAVGLAEATPQLDKHKLAIIMTATGSDVTIDDMNFEQGLINVACEAKACEDPPLYVQRLRQTGAFSNIIYTGYSKEKNKYCFTVQLMMK